MSPFFEWSIRGFAFFNSATSQTQDQNPLLESSGTHLRHTLTEVNSATPPEFPHQWFWGGFEHADPANQGSA